MFNALRPQVEYLVHGLCGITLNDCSSRSWTAAEDVDRAAVLGAAAAVVGCPAAAGLRPQAAGAAAAGLGVPAAVGAGVAAGLRPEAAEDPELRTALPTHCIPGPRRLPVIGSYYKCFPGRKCVCVCVRLCVYVCDNLCLCTSVCSACVCSVCACACVLSCPTTDNVFLCSV